VMFVVWLSFSGAERQYVSRNAVHGSKVLASILSFIGMSIRDSAGSK
jgi:hypothetical protein